MNILAQKLFERQIPEPNSGCWLWLLYCDEDGYGKMHYNYKKHLAHRLSYEAFIGPIPEGLDVCHKCDVPSCINPDHLWLGDAKANADDMVRKGRMVKWNLGHRVSLCKRGHDYDEANTYWNGGKRFCRKCGVLSTQRYQARIARR